MNGNPRSTARIGSHPIHPMLVPFPIALFVATLVCDIVFVSNGNPDWATAAEWTDGLGFVMGALAGVFGLIDVLGEPRIRALRVAWWHAGGNILADLISLYSFWIRYSREESQVHPLGLILSIVVVGIIIVTGWLGGEMVYKHRVAVIPPAGE